MMKKIIKILKALSDENRLRIICLIFQNSGLCVCEIQEIIGLSQPTISFNLKKLEDAELINHSKSALWVNYSIKLSFRFGVAVSPSCTAGEKYSIIPRQFPSSLAPPR